MSQEHFENDEYRDHLATVDEHGKRIWIFPKKPAGWFTDMRTYVSVFLLIILFGLPFIKVNGEPLVLLNVLERYFIIFGVHFTPQDFHLFVLSMLTMIVFIVLFTAIYGRLFCGWVCPQTIFMEMVFRKVEYWIEGDSNAQRRLSKAPWTTGKIIKRVKKHTIFIVISILIAHTFLSYIIGVDEVLKIVSQPPSHNLSGFAAMVVFTMVFYGVFSILREQVCTTICPYGRLQGVLTDDNTILVSYDFVRGEPRGRIKKNRKKKTSNQFAAAKVDNPLTSIQQAVSSANKEVAQPITEESPIKITGDCIDCKLCVKVCPTGIDIRDGVQLECVNCTACIDACDEIMVKVDRPKGLIRYDSNNGIINQSRKIFTPRVKAYSVVLALLIGVNIFFLTGRSVVETVVLRSPGTLFQEVDEENISNLYNYQIFNKSTNPLELELKIKDDKGSIRLVGNAITVTKNEMTEGVFFVDRRKINIKGQKEKITIEVYSDGKLLDKTKVTFLAPAK